MQDNFDAGIDALEGVTSGLALVAADVLGAVDDLALEIGEIDGIEIDETEASNARGGEIHGDGGAESAGADAEDAGGFDALLAGEADFRENQVPRVAADFFIAQFHKSGWGA